MATAKEKLFQEFKAATGGNKGCAVDRAYQQLDKAAADALTDAFADADISIAAIVKVLNAWGISIGKNPVQRHRDGVCTCPQ
jgi:hypothetical protein